MKRRCMSCGTSCNVPDDDYDTPALCPPCAGEDASDLLAAKRWGEQAGAQFLGRERGTRDGER